MNSSSRQDKERAHEPVTIVWFDGTIWGWAPEGSSLLALLKEEALQWASEYDEPQPRVTLEPALIWEESQAAECPTYSQLSCDLVRLKDGPLVSRLDYGLSRRMAD